MKHTNTKSKLGKFYPPIQQCNYFHQKHQKIWTMFLAKHHVSIFLIPPPSISLSSPLPLPLSLPLSLPSLPLLIFIHLSNVYKQLSTGTSSITELPLFLRFFWGLPPLNHMHTLTHSPSQCNNVISLKINYYFDN